MKKYIILLTVILGTLWGCDVLNQEPISMTTEKNAWQTESDVMAEINAIYYLAREALIGNSGGYAHWAYGEFRFGDLIYNSLETYLKDLELKSDNYAIAGLTNWEKFYTGIVQCNLVLEKASLIPDDKFSVYPKSQHLAEAHFMRAFFYFYLCRIWGDVPLQLKATNQEPLPRTKMEDILKQAIKDCQTAIANLPWRYQQEESQVRAIKATRGAAYTLLTEIHMWQQNYEDALVASKAVIDSLDYSGYRLMPMNNSAESDIIFKGRTEEGIFEIDLSTEHKELTKTNLANITLCWPPYVKRQDYFKTVYTPIDTLKKLFPDDVTDLRKTLWFDLTNVYDKDVMPMLLKFKNKSSESTSTTSYYEDNIIIFRLAGLYLLRAEALAHTGTERTEAIRLLNEIRTRAKAPLYSPAEGDLETAIITERRKELIGEGHVWYDMLRNRRILLYKGNIYNESALRDGAWTWPVNQDSFITNPLLNQTTFWL